MTIMLEDNQPYLLINNKLVFHLSDGEITIGRGNHNDLAIVDLRISRQHAKITEISGRYLLSDLNSAGGTYVNRRPIVQRLLEDGDAISLAHQVTINYGEDPANLPAAAREYKRGAEQVYGKLHTSNLMFEDTTPLKMKSP